MLLRICSRINNMIAKPIPTAEAAIRLIVSAGLVYPVSKDQMQAAIAAR